jgi:pimeloyl-ACP methyl ester carboxylesterase
MLPGLGADARLFRAQRPALPELEVPAWLPARWGETLAGYGRRMAATIDTSTPFVLGGVSLGGMIAQEMALHIRPEALVLVSSCRSSRAVRPFLKIIEPLNFVLPVQTFDWFRPYAGVLAGGLPPREKRLWVRMWRDTPREFLQWSCTAAARWPGAVVEGVAIHHIHGEHDEMMALHKVRPDTVVRGGGHLINMTRPGEVNAFLRGVMERVAQRFIKQKTPANVFAGV